MTKLYNNTFKFSCEFGGIIEASLNYNVINQIIKQYHACPIATKFWKNKQLIGDGLSYFIVNSCLTNTTTYEFKVTQQRSECKIVV